jgi:hypothetical protein
MHHLYSMSSAMGCELREGGRKKEEKFLGKEMRKRKRK